VRSDVRADRDGNACDLRVQELALSGVQSRANLQADVRDGLSDV
jgi:hypothetical protein